MRISYFWAPEKVFFSHLLELYFCWLEMTRLTPTSNCHGPILIMKNTIFSSTSGYFSYLGGKGLTSSPEFFFMRVWNEVQKLTLRLFNSIQMPGADSAEETELQVIWKIFHWRTRRNFCYKNSDLAWAWCLCLRYRSYNNVSSLKS